MEAIWEGRQGWCWGRSTDDWNTMSIKASLHHLAVVRQIYSTDSCQLAFHMYCTQTNATHCTPCTGSLSVTQVTFLFSCFPLLLIVLKWLQLQCSFPLFSLCGNVLSKRLSLNRNSFSRMFHSGLQKDYRAGSHTGKLVSYHMFKYTGQVCTANCVFTVVYFSLLHSFLTEASPTVPCNILWSDLCVFTEFCILIYFDKPYAWVSLYLSNRLNAIWQVSRGLAAKALWALFITSLHIGNRMYCIILYFPLFSFPLEKVPCVIGMHCSARLNMLYLHCPLTSGQCGYTSTYHDSCIVPLPKNGLHCNVCLSTVIINKQHLNYSLHVKACSLPAPVLGRKSFLKTDAIILKGTTCHHLTNALLVLKRQVIVILNTFFCFVSFCLCSVQTLDDLYCESVIGWSLTQTQICWVPLKFWILGP